MIRVGIQTDLLNSSHASRGVGSYLKNLLYELKKNKQLEIKELNSLNDNQEVDIIHQPFFDLFYPTLKIRGKVPTVVTIHDITPLLFPMHYPPGIRGRIALWQQKQSLKKVSAVITVSQSSKRDIVKYFNINQDKVYVTYEAAAPHFNKITDKKRLNKTKSKYKLPDQYWIDVGEVNWNKNLLGIGQAATESGINMVFIGKGFITRDNLNHPELKSFKEFLNKYGDNKRFRFLGFVENNELVDLYNLATGLLYPSFYEGFGLPVLEAQACGTLVITSNNSSLPEVGGEGAIYVNPNSVESIVEGIIRVQGTGYRVQLIEQGLENVKRFSWKETAAQTCQVYKDVLEK